MPVQVTYPGVYVQEVSSGVRTITGVSTSVALFIGMTTRGRLDVPTRVLSFADYQRVFGSDTVISEMTDQVRQFFQNGGQQAFVTRIADSTASAAGVDIENEEGTVVLNVSAKEAGVDGNLIRLEVDYNTPSPENTFNLRVFRQMVNAFGEIEVETDETFSDLGMDASNGRYVKTIVNQQSTLIDVDVPVDVTDADEGYSLSGVLVDSADDDIAATTLNGQISATSNSIQISVDRNPFVLVVMPTLPIGPADPNPLQAWQDAINLALNSVGANARATLVAGPTDSRYVEFRSVDDADTPIQGGSVVIRPAPINDASVNLQLGVDQGGLEVNGFSALRPAPTGVFAKFGTGTTVTSFTSFAGAEQDSFGQWALQYAGGSASHTDTPTFAAPGSRMYIGTVSIGIGEGSLLNVRQNLQVLADSVNANADDKWEASLHGYRLLLLPKFGNVHTDTTATFTSDGAFDIGAAGQFFIGPPNVASYSLGTTGAGTYQDNGSLGQNGGVPGTPDYTDVFDIVDREVDLFNLMILPRANGQSDGDREKVWGPASGFCLKRRAFLLVDPRADAGVWKTADEVNSDIQQLRVGLVKDHAAIYWPRVKISTNGSTKAIDPSGSIAGLMARTDANRGVWKAPAGIQADIRGIRGVEHTMSDPENGIINPQAVNAIRIFPNGIISWGARTMDGFDNSGNDDYKYVPVRRITLFIEESLYRGLKFAVFEPNDEPLWAQIRLTAGAFMNNLFRQSAFQGQKASDAYFVKVDSETTTQNDINLGIVNVIVGFAPLKPAEFVVITIQQKAGQVQT